MPVHGQKNGQRDCQKRELVPKVPQTASTVVTQIQDLTEEKKGDASVPDDVDDKDEDVGRSRLMEADGSNRHVLPDVPAALKVHLQNHFTEDRQLTIVDGQNDLNVVGLSVDPLPILKIPHSILCLL